MKTSILSSVVFCILFTVCLPGCKTNKTNRILVVTGGHEFDHTNFIRMFESFDDVDFTEVTQPEANDLYGCDSIDDYDVLVLYDMVQEITEAQKSAFVSMLENGKGMLFLHHSIASYQDWDEFLQILGARYHLEAWIKEGDSIPASTYQEGLDLGVRIADKQHPVTKGVTDFVIHDEAYNGVEMWPGIHPLLTTDDPESMEVVAWTNEYGESRVVYIQMGHDNNAFSDENYRTLVRQAIEWVK